MRVNDRHLLGRWSRRLCFGLGFVALLLQAAALGLPMPAGAAETPAWLSGSLCSEDGGGSPKHGNHVCPVCFVVAQANSAVPPQIPLLVSTGLPAAGQPLPPVLSIPARQQAGAIAEPRAPPPSPVT